MYKIIVVLSIFLVISTARIVRREAATTGPEMMMEHAEVIPILKSVSENEADGSYVFSYEGGDGTAREEKGTIMNAGSDEAYVAVVGSYKYIDVNGETIDVHYTADENGFIPEGGNIPTSISKAARAGIAHETE